jgi:hypothetical protein
MTMQTDMPARSMAIDQIHRVTEDLLRTGTATGADGNERQVFPVALPQREAVALRDWVLHERSVHTIEVGLAFGFSTLHICEGLLLNGNQDASNVAIDPHQITGYSSVGLRVLENAGVAHMVEYHEDESQMLLPQFVR